MTFMNACTQEGFDRFLKSSIAPSVHNKARDVRNRMVACQNLATQNASLSNHRVAQSWGE
ncbi:hypothetical protein GMO_10240 [Gluconobacter morbifer G707]|uniref:Transposase n=1 Tax=Gluconobacter morbifer G707 TaxID=1088869 RepID=G6XIS8_9PROT|nr:hypothetical protein GMO_10240 [Gluconobacter morbifer G707]